MEELIEELDKLSDQWGCDGCEDAMDKYEWNIDNHIKSILEKHKNSYSLVYRDFVNSGDYYRCYIFAFIGIDNKLYLKSVEIEDC